MNRDIILSVNGLSQTFKSGGESVRALNNVSFDIERGEIFGLVGESGSGKTTTGRIIMGFYSPSGGTVSFGGEVIRSGEGEIRGEIARIKAQRRSEIARLKLHAAGHPKDIRSVMKNIDYVKNYYQNKLSKLENQLSLAASVNKKWRGRTHPDIRMVFQDPSASLNPRMTVEQIVSEALEIDGVSNSSERRRRTVEVLSAVGLPSSALSRYPHEFSGGQKQRIGIARAVITHPKLLIADEPVSALDVSVGAQVINLLCDLAAEMSISVLFIAHDLSLVRHVCGRVGVMYKGHLVELAESGELFSNPLHPYTKALLSAVPMPDPKRAKNMTRVHFSADAEALGSTLVEPCRGHKVLSGGALNEYKQ